MQLTPLEQRIHDLIAPSLTAMGYGVVRVRLRDGAGKRVLEVMAERSDAAPMSVDDCALISDTVSLKLDVEDPISGAYDLEVSSPGLDRPLMQAEDFKRFLGSMIKLETLLPIQGQRRFKGVIQRAEDEELTLALENGLTQPIHYSGVRSAKLVPEAPLFKKKKTA